MGAGSLVCKDPDLEAFRDGGNDITKTYFYRFFSPKNLTMQTQRRWWRVGYHYRNAKKKYVVKHVRRNVLPATRASPDSEASRVTRRRADTSGEAGPERKTDTTGQQKCTRGWLTENARPTHSRRSRRSRTNRELCFRQHNDADVSPAPTWQSLRYQCSCSHRLNLRHDDARFDAVQGQLIRTSSASAHGVTPFDGRTTNRRAVKVGTHDAKKDNILRKPQTKFGQQQGSSPFERIGIESRDLELQVFFGRSLKFSDGSARENVKHSDFRAGKKCLMWLIFRKSRTTVFGWSDFRPILSPFFSHRVFQP